MSFCLADALFYGSYHAAFFECVIEGKLFHVQYMTLPYEKYAQTKFNRLFGKNVVHSGTNHGTK